VSICVHIDTQISRSTCVHIDIKHIHIGQNCILQYTTAAAHRSLLEFELMSSTPPHVGLTDFNFGADFGDFGGDFGASCGFDADFGAVFGNVADFFGGSVTSDVEVDSCGSSSDDRSGHCRRQRRRWRHRWRNQLSRVESVKNSS
jgi:hypothetical protein